MLNSYQLDADKMTAWVEATRPKMYVASLVSLALVAVIALQNGAFEPLLFFVAMLMVVFFQTTANLVNEYADFVRGTDDLKQAGQSMTLKKGTLTPDEVLIGSILVTLAGLTAGLFLAVQSGMGVMVFVVLMALIAIGYTAGPFPFAYHGLGETAVGLFFGPVTIVGTYYAMHPSLTVAEGVRMTLYSLPIMLTCAAILHANNLRDLEADRAANKRTLAVMFGREFGNKEYNVLLGGAFAVQLGLVMVGWMPPLTLLTVVLIPQALKLMRSYDGETDVQQLHAAHGKTAKFHAQFGLLMIVGWALWLFFV